MTCFYMPDGQTLNQWCKKNKKNYCTIWRRLDKYGVLPSQAIDDKYMKLKFACKHRYNGLPLTDYCGGCFSKKYRYVMVMRHKYNWSIEKAIQRYEGKYGKPN